MREIDLDGRRAILLEWRDCNLSQGASEDIRSLLNDGFCVNLYFNASIKARNFWNWLYDTVLLSVKDETKHR